MTLDTATRPTLIEVTLSGDHSRAAHVLGAATDAILASGASELVVDLGKNAVDPRLLGALHTWFRRHATLLRTRTRAHAYVVPSFWHAIQWRLALLLDRPPVPARVVRSRGQADGWLSARRQERSR